MNKDTATRLVDEVGQTGDVLHGEILQFLLVIVRATDVELGTGNSLFETRGRDLDTKSGLDLLVVNVRRLIVSSPLRFDQRTLTRSSRIG